MYVPDTTKIANTVCYALQIKHSAELAHYFDMISHNTCSHSFADYVFESLIHTMIISSLKTFIWYDSDDSLKDVSTVAPSQIISSQKKLSKVTFSFYYWPALTNYPEMDSA